MARIQKQSIASIMKRILPGTLVLFYLVFVITGLYCRCIETGTSDHNNHQHVAKAESEKSADHDHSHDHGHEQPPPGHHSTPHSPCYCNGIDASALVSSFETEFAKTTCATLLPINSVQVIALFSLPPFQFVTANDHGPPAQVSIYLKNHSFLI